LCAASFRPGASPPPLSWIGLAHGEPDFIRRIRSAGIN
jgi:hypothetical protein